MLISEIGFPEPLLFIVEISKALFFRKPYLGAKIVFFLSEKVCKLKQVNLYMLPYASFG